MANFQEMLDSVVHSTGKSLAVPIPVPSGPRQPGHSTVADRESEKVTKQLNKGNKSFITDRLVGIILTKKKVTLKNQIA